MNNIEQEENKKQIQEVIEKLYDLISERYDITDADMIKRRMIYTVEATVINKQKGGVIIAMFNKLD